MKAAISSVLSLFICIQFRSHSVKLYFMTKVNLPAPGCACRVIGILMVARERALAQQMKRLKVHRVWRCCADCSLWSGQATSGAHGWVCSRVLLRLSTAGNHCSWPKGSCPSWLYSYHCWFSFRLFSTYWSLRVRIDQKRLFLLLLVLIFCWRLLYGVLWFPALKAIKPENVSCWMEE